MPAASVRKPESETGSISCRGMDGKSFRIGRFVLGSEDPDIAWRRDNSGKQNVTHETLGGIGAGDNFPTPPVPVQDQGPEVAGSIGREVTTKRPDVVGRIGRQAGTMGSSLVPMFGLGTTFQVLPSQCKINVRLGSLSAFAGVKKPTAQALFGDSASTASSLFVPFVTFGVATSAHSEPFQCMAKV